MRTLGGIVGTGVEALALYASLASNVGPSRKGQRAVRQLAVSTWPSDASGIHDFTLHEEGGATGVTRGPARSNGRINRFVLVRLCRHLVLD